MPFFSQDRPRARFAGMALSPQRGVWSANPLTIVMSPPWSNRSQVKSSHYYSCIRIPDFLFVIMTLSKFTSTLDTPGVDILEFQDWEPLGGYTRGIPGIILLRAPSPVYPARAPHLHTVFPPLGARHWAPPPEGVLAPASKTPNRLGGQPVHRGPEGSQSSQHLSTLYCHKHQGGILGKKQSFRRFVGLSCENRGRRKVEGS